MSVRSRGTARATLENTIFLAPPHLHSATYLENLTNSVHIRMGGCTCALPLRLLTFFVRLRCDGMRISPVSLASELGYLSSLRLCQEKESDFAVL
jgi:hypothetical protein